MSYAIILCPHADTGIIRQWLIIESRHIWVNRRIAEILGQVKAPDLTELRVIRYQTPHKVIFYLEYGQTSSLITAADAAFILQQQGILSPELTSQPLSRITEALIKSTPKQIPYWINDVNENGIVWYCVDYRGHWLVRYRTRTEAIRAMRMLYPLGQPNVRWGKATFETCRMVIETINWEQAKWEQEEYLNNPCHDFQLVGMSTPCCSRVTRKLKPSTLLLPAPPLADASLQTEEKPKKIRRKSEPSYKSMTEQAHKKWQGERSAPQSPSNPKSKKGSRHAHKM